MEQPKKEELALSATSDLVLEKTPRSFFWFVAQGAVLKGPYSTHELKSLVEKKELSEKLFAWRDGYHEWRPLYGIEEFKTERVEDLSYPSVPVPGAHAPVLLPQYSDPRHPNKVPVYKVRYGKARWSDLKKTEVAVLFSISLVFTLMMLSLAFYVFEQEWQTVWGKRVSGMLYTVGQSTTPPLPSYLVEPIQSAPGLKHQEEHYVAVEIESDIGRYKSEQFAGHTLQSNLPKEALQNLDWDKSNTYTRRMRVQGVIDLKNPALLHVENPGLPFEPLLSRRLSK